MDDQGLKVRYTFKNQQNVVLGCSLYTVHRHDHGHLHEKMPGKHISTGAASSCGADPKALNPKCRRRKASNHGLRVLPKKYSQFDGICIRSGPLQEKILHSSGVI